MKTINLYVTSIAASDYNARGYTVAAIDPNPNIGLHGRSFESGCAVTFVVSVDDDAIARDDIYGAAGIEDGNGGRNVLHYSSQEKFFSMPEKMTMNEAKRAGCLGFYKCVKL